MDLYTKLLELDLQLLKAEVAAGLMDGLPIDAAKNFDFSEKLQ